MVGSYSADDIIAFARRSIEDAVDGRTVDDILNDPTAKTIIESLLGNSGNISELKKEAEHLLKEGVFLYVLKNVFYNVLTRRVNNDGIISNVLFDAFGQVKVLELAETIRARLIPLIDALSRFDWGSVNIDVIGKIFERLVHEERRHLLGQYYTDDAVADLIVSQIDEPGIILDPACGSGTFLMRALNYLASTGVGKSEILRKLVGVDINRNAVALAKVNLYIAGLEELEKGRVFTPNVMQADYFQKWYEADYIVTNPPYTRQEEMKMAYFNENYKQYLERVVSDIEGWNKRASIYAYFIVKSLKEARKGIGYLVENSWLNAEYGRPIRERLFSKDVETIVIEPLVERWFEDADVNTNVIITKKYGNLGKHTFVFLKKGLRELIGDPPPSSNFIATQRYYKRIRELVEKWKKVAPSTVLEDNEAKVVGLDSSTAQRIEEKLGRFAFLRGPKSYIELVFSFLKGDERVVKLDDVVELGRGVMTGANDYFYLPSKFWRLVEDTEEYLEVTNGVRRIRISKNYLKPLIRPAHLRNSTYEVTGVPKLGKEDYVLWIDDPNGIRDPGTREYIEWLVNVLPRKMSGNWRIRMRDTSGWQFLFRSAVNTNYSIYFNRLPSHQVDARFYTGRPKNGNGDAVVVLYGLLNSTLTYIGIELFGRTNMGEGVLDVRKADCETVPIPSPKRFAEFLDENSLRDKFVESVRKLMKRKPVSIEEELKQEDRRLIDEIVFEFLWRKDRDAVIGEIYDAVTELSAARIAKSSRRGVKL